MSSRTHSLSGKKAVECNIRAREPSIDYLIEADGLESSPEHGAQNYLYSRCQPRRNLRHAVGMDAHQDTEAAAVTTLLGHIAAVLPPSLRPLIYEAAPLLSVSAARLGLEALDSERRAIRFSSAVERASEFPLMGRVYFGALNLLQWQVPANVRQALQAVLTQAITGNFESTRKLLFLIAQRKDDPEAALCRFLLWSAVRLNLLILTWGEPQVEALGVLDRIEDRTEAALRELLTIEDIRDPDCRPLHTLVAALLVDVYASAKHLLTGATTEADAEQLDALQIIRQLDARDAALFHPGRFSGIAGCQQILDRFPQHHYASVNAMQQQRTRTRKQVRNELAGLNSKSDRFIDLILAMDS